MFSNFNVLLLFPPLTKQLNFSFGGAILSVIMMANAKALLLDAKE